MRRGILLAGVWMFGVVIAVTLAFAAVARVANGVAPNDVAHLSKTDIDDELTGTTAPAPSTSPTTGTSTTSRPGSTSTTSTSPSSSLATSGATTPTTHATTLTAPPVTGSSTPPTAPPTATTSPRPPPVAPHNTVTTSQGGTVYTRCTGPDTIAYVAAVPKTGYARTVDVEAPTGVHQTFVNGRHRSDIQAECSNGVVHAQVEEETEDD